QLPGGWSPIAAIDVGPGGLVFGQTAALTAPNVGALPSNADVVVVRYDVGAHQWIAVGPSRVSADGWTIAFAVSGTCQFAAVAADDAPSTPPAAQPDAPLAGVATVEIPDAATATGEVVPRSAPPGPDVRSVGSVLVQNTAPLPSGSVLHAHVSERFDLSDQSHLVPAPYIEDVVLFAKGRPTGAGVLGATFPITPSRSYTIQDLLHGVVAIDVVRDLDVVSAAIVGAAGGTTSDPEGDSLEVPAGATTADAAIAVRRVDPAQTSVPVPPGFDLLAAVDVELVGITLAQTGRLAIPAGSTVTSTDQVVVARVASDPAGALRLVLAAEATLSGGRLITTTSVGSLTFAGITTGGQFLFLRAQQPVGFITGQVSDSAGSARAGVVVTTDTSAFADITGSAGRFVVAGRVGSDSTATATDTNTRDTGTRTVHVTAREEAVAADLTLAAASLTVSATNPVASAANVPLDASIAIDFSAPLDPASVSATSVVVQANGAPVSGQRLLSSDRRRLTFRPDAPLAGKTAYALTLTGIRSTIGRPLTGF